MSEHPTGGRDRSRTRLDPEERRSQIIAASIQAFSGRDPAEVSFESIAEAAGVSRSLVYSYFGDKGQLFASAYEHALRCFDTKLDADLEGVHGDRERLDRAMRTYLTFAREHRDMWNVISTAGTARHEAVREAVAARSLLVAQRLGDTSDGGLLVSGVIGMIEAAATHMLDNDADADELADLLAQVVWTGISSLGEDASNG